MTHHEQPAEIDLLNSFNEAFNRHDVEAMMAMMTPDCLFDNTSTAPDGTLFQGQANVRRFWHDFFANSPHAHREFEEIFAHGDRAVQRWTYSWVAAHGA